MDGKSKDQATGGIAGAAIGFAAAGPAGALVGGLGGVALGSRETDHNDTLRETYYELAEATTDDARIYVDHVEVTGDAGTPDGVISDVDMVPDIVVVDQYGANLVIEVETVDGINDDIKHAVDQLNDFQTGGFKRLLVAPESELEGVEEWAAENYDGGPIEKEVTTTTPEGAASYV